MSTIVDAKKHLKDRCLGQEGFIGIGIGKVGSRDALRVYVTDPGTEVAQSVAKTGEFEGHPVLIEVTSSVEALSR